MSGLGGDEMALLPCPNGYNLRHSASEKLAPVLDVAREQRGDGKIVIDNSMT